MPEFTPEELTRLEDAIERLDVSAESGQVLATGPESFVPRQAVGIRDHETMTPAVTTRLREYQRIIALTRSALPDEEPSAGVLDAVVAEARAVVDDVPTVERAAPHNRRRWWFPTLALAGVAALVALLVFVPDQNQDRLGDVAATESIAVARSEPALQIPAPPGARGQPSRPAEEASYGADHSVQPEATAAEPSAAEPTRVFGAEPDRLETNGANKEPVRHLRPRSGSAGGQATDRKARRSSSKKKAKPAASSRDEGLGTLAGEASAAPRSTKGEAAKTEDIRESELGRAHRLRRTKRCQAARGAYERAYAQVQSARHRAEAQAGLGLCFERDGKVARANEHISRAIAIDSGIEAWIAGERQRAP